jgi:hypothetical protein
MAGRSGKLPVFNIFFSIFQFNGFCWSFLGDYFFMYSFFAVCEEVETFLSEFLSLDCADANPAMLRKNKVEMIIFFLAMHFYNVTNGWPFLQAADHRINAAVPFICRGCLSSRLT